MRMYLTQYINDFQYPSLTDEFLRTWKRRVSASCCATRKLGRPLGLLKSFTFLFREAELRTALLDSAQCEVTPAVSL